METRKGMSQILTLIVAASVLMMTGLTIIMMSQGALSGIFSSSNRKSCIQSLKTTCEFSSTGSEHTLPESCKTAGVSAADVPGNAVQRVGKDTYICS